MAYLNKIRRVKVFGWEKQNIKPSTAIYQVSPHRLVTHYSFVKVLRICFKLPFPMRPHFQCALQYSTVKWGLKWGLYITAQSLFFFLISESKTTWTNLQKHNRLKYFLQNNSVMDPHHNSLKSKATAQHSSIRLLSVKTPPGYVMKTCLSFP